MSNKKSFILYADLLQSIEYLTMEERGVLFTHLLEYVNGNNPILEDRLLLTAWRPIELQLKRDLESYENTKKENSLKGRMGNLKRYHIDLYELVRDNSITIEEAENVAGARKLSQVRDLASQNVANLADNDNDTDNDTDTDNDINNTLRTSEVEADKLNFDDYLTFWNTFAVNFPNVRTLTDSRKTKLKKIIKKYGNENFKLAIELTNESVFFKDAKAKDSKWNTLDWFINETNFIKILENKYQNNGKQQTNTSKSNFNAQEVGASAFNIISQALRK